MVVSMVLLLSDNAEIFQQRFLADENFSTFSLAGADVMDTILSDQHPNRMLGNALNRGNCFFDCNHFHGLGSSGLRMLLLDELHQEVEDPVNCFLFLFSVHHVHSYSWIGTHCAHTQAGCTVFCSAILNGQLTIPVGWLYKQGDSCIYAQGVNLCGRNTARTSNNLNICCHTSGSIH